MTDHREPPPGAAPGEKWPEEDEVEEDWPPRDAPRERDRESGQHLIWVLLAAGIMILIGWW